MTKHGGKATQDVNPLSLRSKRNETITPMTDTTKRFARPTQDEVSYITLSSEVGKACANCRWFDGRDGSYCYIIQNDPEDILATGYCSRWEEQPAPEEPVIEIIAETVVIETSEMEGKEAEDNPSSLKRWEGIPIIKGWAKKLSGLREKPLVEPGETSGFKVFRHDGKDLWRAWWSNDFKDKDEEIIERAAHDKYLARLENGFVPMPSLWFWHTKGSEHGRALWIGRIGHIMVAVGEFADTPKAKAFIKHYRKTKTRYGVSHGFTYPTWALEDGVYADYNTFELSPLPIKAAANPYTRFEEVQKMSMSDEKRLALVAAVGEEIANEIIGETDKASKALEGLGLTFKDFADIPAAKAAAADKDEGEPLLGKMLLAMITSQGELTQKQVALEERYLAQETTHKDAEKALKDKNDVLQAANEKLKGEQELAPRASQADSTVITDEDAKKALVDKGADYDPFYGELNIPKEQPHA